MTRAGWVIAIIGGKLTGGIAPHWYRADSIDEPCRFRGCGRPAVEHWQHVGEWMLPRRERWAAIGQRAASRLRRRP